MHAACICARSQWNDGGPVSIRAYRSPVIVVCYVPSQPLAQLRRAFPAPHNVSNASTWDALVSHIRDRQCDVAIVDPCTGGEHLAPERLNDLASVVTPPSAIPVVGYVSVTAAGMRAVQSLVRLGAAEIVIRGVDDATDALATVVHRAVAAGVAGRLMQCAGIPFEALPPRVAAALEIMFNRPDQLRSVGDLALAAKTTRRSLDRWLARAGLSSARTLLSCARANAAFHLLTAGRVRRAEAASLLGYASPRSLTRELHAVTGYSASAIPAELSREAFVAVVGRRLLRSPSGATVVGSY
jgi:AraC-like DNA-binding protein